jgi:hypothetical protein
MWVSIICAWVDADDFARAFGETQQQSHRARFQSHAFLTARDFAGQRIHEPVADAQSFGRRVPHTRSTIAPAPQRRVAFRTLQTLSTRFQDSCGRGNA